jgi:hypothetical protein
MGESDSPKMMMPKEMVVSRQNRSGPGLRRAKTIPGHGIDEGRRSSSFGWIKTADHLTQEGARIRMMFGKHRLRVRATVRQLIGKWLQPKNEGPSATQPRTPNTLTGSDNYYNSHHN